jgi:uncharacterized protein with FMN-binding domain
MTWTPMDIVTGIVVFVIIICFGLIFYQQAEFKATATEKCEQIVDKYDNHTISVRDGNYVNTQTVYHGYDVCRSTKDGNITSRRSLGYGTETQISLMGLRL